MPSDKTLRLLRAIENVIEEAPEEERTELAAAFTEYATTYHRSVRRTLNEKLMLGTIYVSIVDMALDDDQMAAVYMATE